ncbi:MAG: tetratricopeptide repeat protein [Polyangiaceae bacterium]|jgi:thioredoxin-like negative regulator of GroEL
MDAKPEHPSELRQHIERKLARAVDPRSVLPLLHRLARLADEESDDAFFAQLLLAELLVERHPWRAALHARRVVARRPADDRGWATVALCHALLGNYRSAVAAYRRALDRAPNNPWYAHNLGHLLDVALHRGDEAAAILSRAYRRAPHCGDVAASYAHALARTGKLAEARKVVHRALRRSPSHEHAALLEWLDAGAPLDGDQTVSGVAAMHAPYAKYSLARVVVRYPRVQCSPPDRGTSPGVDPRLQDILSRGLERLPLDANQRERARSLARDTSGQWARPSGLGTACYGRRSSRSGISALAAAVAYAIVFVDRVPLSQSEVAACFRVGVASVRARFVELRSHLDLLPGDARYRTVRRH